LEFIAIQLLNGLSWAMLLFLFTSGFTLIFGLMKLINLTHGSYYLFGAYVGVTCFALTRSFILSIIVGGISIGILGMLMQRILLKRYEESHDTQVLLTFGFILFFSDLALTVWGGEPKTIPIPHLLERSITLGTLIFPAYRLLIIVVGLLTATLLWWFLKSKYGRIPTKHPFGNCIKLFLGPRGHT